MATAADTRQDRETKSKELVQRRLNHAAKLITSYSGHFAAVVPSHIKPAAFLELAIAYVKRDQSREPTLLQVAEANPASLILALRECAALGHLPMKGIFSLVPYPDKTQPGGVAVVGMEEWRGVVERMYRAGGVQSVHVNVGRDNDRVCHFNPTRMLLPEHDYDEFAPPEVRGSLKVVYAWARLINGGTSQVAWLPRYEVHRHRATSKSIRADGGGNFWGPVDGEGPNTEAMWRKTALHVLEGLVPTSAEYRWQVAAAEAGARGWDAVPDRSVSPVYSDVQDAELVEDNGPAEGWPQVAQPGSGGQRDG